MNEKEFSDNFENLFDIAHANALDMMKINEDKEFLIAQREKGRRGAMSSVDTILSRKEQQREKKYAKEQDRRCRSKAETESLQQQVILDSSSHSSDDEKTNDPDQSDDECWESQPPAKRSQNNFVSPMLSATLDRNKVSSRSAVMIIGETAKSLGHDIRSLTLSRSSIQRQRDLHRTRSAARIQDNFGTDSALVVHWDGKLIPDICNREMVDRLPIIVSSFDGSTQLLAVPKLSSGTGSAQAHAVYKALNDWNIADDVQGLCFDTTRSNTGRKSGACVLLEQLLGRDLLYLACRHHILELVAGTAFNEMMGSSSAPDILLFKRFQSHWQKINTSQYEDSNTDQVARDALSDVMQDLKAFFISAVTSDQPRDDYRELIEITMIFLGINPPRGIRFRPPGAMHRARWMAKIIYTFKVWMFRSQFTITMREEKGLRDLCIFFAKVYVKAWYKAPIVTEAPNNDLQLLISLLRYRSVNSAISSATSRKMLLHLWYLSESLVGLAFFDKSLGCDIKDKMARAVFEVDGPEDDPPKTAKLDLVSSYELQKKSVADFVTKNSISLFTKLRLPHGFLKLPASQWVENIDYQVAAKAVSNLPATNDHAERGVALIQQYSGSLTKDEDQLQFLMQVVAENRKRFPKASKRALISQ